MNKKTMPKREYQPFVFHVNDSDDGLRIDSFLHQKLPEYSRTFFKNLLQHKNILYNDGVILKPSTLVHTGDKIQVTIPHKTQKNTDTIAQDLQRFPVECLAETTDFLVINKPAGLLVHNTNVDPLSTTLVDWLKIHYPSIINIGESDRPGIVHRLDRNTSGVMLVAKNKGGYKKLMDLFKNRKIKKIYAALVKGHPDRQGTVNFPIGRHPHQRHKMIAYKQSPSPQVGARKAQSDYTVVEYLPDTTYLQISPKTGRTHQIRVHMSALGHPIVGDHIYGSLSCHIKRHALHAQTIEFELNGIPYQFSSPIPQDFLLAIDALK
jgi:23S rRNA pseudouridine1911/1915/1917 synthase